MKLLLVEDDLRLADYLKKGLEEEGFVVDLARNGIDGLHLATQGHHEVIILDGMLPDIDGLAVLAALRQSKTTPVMMLTARGMTEDKVNGFRSGADDYLVKPFAFAELVARLHALGRRRAGAANEPAQTSLSLLDLELDAVRRTARRDGRELRLTAKEFALLWLLLRRKGEVVGRTEIAESVWDMNFDSDTNVIDVAVRRLRAKMDDPFEVQLLHTVRGVGYVLDVRAQAAGAA
ncbi:MAG: heavy metal response regulator transcription factor [Limnobacter sp.]|uniref:heavy metal response regulator transcription factor n=1 Tax=Limnobacter sp. TaxID=2003368 RepID=UPI00391BC0B3